MGVTSDRRAAQGRAALRSWNGPCLLRGRMRSPGVPSRPAPGVAALLSPTREGGFCTYRASFQWGGTDSASEKAEHDRQGVGYHVSCHPIQSERTTWI